QGLYDTDRRPNELLTEVLIPVPRANTVSVFLELARRHGDFAIAGVAFQLLVQRGIVGDARLVYFGSEDKPMLAADASAAIRGQPLGVHSYDAAVAALAGDLSPMSNAQGSAKLRLHLQRVLTRRALDAAQQRAQAA